MPYKIIAKTLFSIYFSQSIYYFYFSIFIFPPSAHIFLNYLVVVNFIFMWKLHVTDIEKKEEKRKEKEKDKLVLTKILIFSDPHYTILIVSPVCNEPGMHG